MTIDKKDMLNSILDSISRIDYIKPEDIPNIDLYMDQVLTLYLFTTLRICYQLKISRPYLHR